MKSDIKSPSCDVLPQDTTIIRKELSWSLINPRSFIPHKLFPNTRSAVLLGSKIAVDTRICYARLRTPRPYFERM
jgi:hypothetical protein